MPGPEIISQIWFTQKGNENKEPNNVVLKDYYADSVTAEDAEFLAFLLKQETIVFKDVSQLQKTTNSRVFPNYKNKTTYIPCCGRLFHFRVLLIGQLYSKISLTLKDLAVLLMHWTILSKWQESLLHMKRLVMQGYATCIFVVFFKSSQKSKCRQWTVDIVPGHSVIWCPESRFWQSFPFPSS